jgi:hypothetical protein
MDTLPFLPSQSVSVLRALERFPTDKMTVLAQHVVVGEAFVHQRVPLALGHRRRFLLVIVSKANVSHNFVRLCELAPLAPCSRAAESKKTGCKPRRAATSSFTRPHFPKALDRLERPKSFPIQRGSNSRIKSRSHPLVVPRHAKSTASCLNGRTPPITTSYGVRSTAAL